MPQARAAVLRDIGHSLAMRGIRPPHSPRRVPATDGAARCRAGWACPAPTNQSRTAAVRRLALLA